MKKIAIIIFATIVYLSAYSQEMNTLFSSNDKETTFGGYGAPIIRASQVNGTFGTAIGGKGGFTINRSITFGGIGMGYVSDYAFIGDNFAGNQNADLHLGMGAGGIFLEYTIAMEKTVHISIPINIMAGGVIISDEKIHQTNQNVDDDIESSAVFLLEPGINIEFNVTKYFIPTLNIGYRIAMGSSLKSLSNQDLSGFHIGLEFKFGKF